MRKRWVLSLLLSTASAFGQEGFLGSKRTAVQSLGNGSSGSLQLLQMLVALGLVAALVKWVLPKLASRARLGRSAGSTHGLVLEGSLQLGSSSAHLLRVGERRLLVGSGAQGVSLIAELEAERAAPERAAFFEVLDDARENLNSHSPPDSAEMLRRLNELAGPTKK